MVRSFKTSDLDTIMQIWLSSNRDTHNFIPDSYWISSFDSVKAVIPQSELFIHEEDDQITGFLGIIDGFIAGFFVRRELRSRSIGLLLLNHAKEKYPKLSLRVYTKNIKAIHFYQREGFHITATSIDKSTGEEELLMEWKS